MKRFRSQLSEEGEDYGDDLRYVRLYDHAERVRDVDRVAREGEIKVWRVNEDARATHVQERADSKIGLPTCTKGLKNFYRGCGHHQAIVLRCGKPTCPECEKLRAQEAQEKWAPVLKRMKRPKMIVLAVASSPSLASALALLMMCFARFLDLRLGERARRPYKAAALKFVAEHVGEFNKHHAEDPTRKSAAQWSTSVRLFFDRDLPAKEKQLQANAVRQGKQFKGLKVRDLLFGFRALEVTWHIITGWHPHFHLAVDGMFLPFPALLTLWMSACTIKGECYAALADPDEQLAEGEVMGRTAHISALRDVAEVIKYVTKHQDYKSGAGLSAEQRRELEEALHRKKRIWPLGGARPEPLAKAPCPGCQDSSCPCQPADTVREYVANDIWKTGDGRYIRYHREKGKGLMWDDLGTGAERPFSSHDVWLPDASSSPSAFQPPGPPP